MAWHEPRALAIEQVYFGRNVGSAMVVGQASGVAMLAAAQRGIACFAYTPQAIKMAVCGSGAAGKEQVQRMVGTLLGLPEPPTPDHAADALAVAICHGGGEGRRQAVAHERRLAGAAAARRQTTLRPAGGRMIAAVRGEVLVRRPDHVVIDAHGVGYRLAVSTETLKAVPAAGSDTFLHAELIAREDSLALYGFASEDERDLFRMLISVSGVGPKVGDRGALRRQLARAPAGDRGGRHQTLPGGAGDRQTDGGADHRRAPRQGRRRARGRLRRSSPPRKATPAPSPATASSTSATSRSRPSSCSTGWRATTPRQLLAGALRKAGANR